MRKIVFIIIGVVIVIILFLVWLYLIIFENPSSPQDVFTNLGFIEEPTERGVAEDETVDEVTDIVTTVPSLRGQTLRQLTTRPVAGFTFVEDEDQLIVRYVERGTGYIYDINTLDGVELTLSRTTIPRTAEAEFSEDGTHVSLTVYERTFKSTSVGSINGETGSLNRVPLPPNAKNISFTSDNKVLYTHFNNNETVGYDFDSSSGVRRELFKTPLRDIVINWNDGLNIIMHTKPSHRLPGFAYTIEQNNFTRLSGGLNALAVLADDRYILKTHLHNGQLRSFTSSMGSDTQIMQTHSLLPEKCTFSSEPEAYLWCASPVGFIDGNNLTNWYKGLNNFSDFLWEINIEEGWSRSLADIQSISGRQIDVDRMTVSPNNTYLLFRNKIDGSLWIYDLSL